MIMHRNNVGFIEKYFNIWPSDGLNSRCMLIKYSLLANVFWSVSMKFCMECRKIIIIYQLCKRKLGYDAYLPILDFWAGFASIGLHCRLRV